MDVKPVGISKDATPVKLEPTRHQIEVAPEALDQVEQVWSSVFFSAEQKAPRSVIVTGAEPSEGATELAVALALVGASANHGSRIALVDLNLREPRVAHVVGVPESPGVINTLETGELMGGTNVLLAHGQFTVVPSGKPNSKPTPPVDPTTVGRLIQHLLKQHDHVIVDAPAVNRHATVATLAGIVDGVLLVARQGVTRREAVAEAKRRIELAQGRLIGVVLNMREFPVPSFLYRRM